jgi:CheY-like chemotaxis protein
MRMHDEPLRVLIVDDDEAVRNLLSDCLNLEGCHATGFDNVDDALRLLFYSGLPACEIPDLVVIDLELAGQDKQGKDLIIELVQRDLASEIVAISGNLPTSELEFALSLGAASYLTKPFPNIFDVVEELLNLARIGRKRRLYREAAEKSVGSPERRVRPVFLSYASAEQTIANMARRSLEARSVGVWYAPTNLPPGAPFHTELRAAIDECRVFLAVLTQGYADSTMCMAELTRFQRRYNEPGDSSVLLLPVLACAAPELRRNKALASILDSLQCVDLSRRLVDGLTVILGRVQWFLGRS